MKRLNTLLLLLLAALLIIPCEGVSAQRRRSSKRGGNPNITSYIDVYGGAGYSQFMHNIEKMSEQNWRNQLGVSVPGGGAGMIGFGYLMKYKSNFNFSVNLEFMFLNSTTRLDSIQYYGDFKYRDQITDVEMDYYMNFHKLREQQNRLSINLPIMFGAQFQRYYFMVGAKASLSLLGNFSTKSLMTTWLVDPMIIDPLENIPNHTLTTRQVKGKGGLDFGIDIAASAEFGVIMDEWMPESWLSIGKGRNKMPVSYRLGAFVDYGVININANAPKTRGNAKTNGSFSFNPSTNTFDNSHTVVSFPGVTADANGTITVPGSVMDQVYPTSLLKSHLSRDTKLNSLVVGAKFTVLFQVSPKPKPVKKRPRPRPRPKPVNISPDPPFFYCIVSDFETEEPLDACVQLYRLDANLDTVFTAFSDNVTGFVANQMKSNKFGIRVRREGYIEYNDTIFQINNDTLFVDLQPIKKNTVIILQNLFFDTDKTTIQNTSAQSLDDMYKLLVENPKIEVEITGHTDNVGSDRYNMKLSAGRAKAVYDEMVKRGINPNRMTWKGKGEREPIDTNDTPEGRQENRRVEFKITKDK